MKRNENKKSLKKKVLVVSGLALLLGLIGYTGGNTYAKYITSKDTGSVTATVAKWGYVVTTDAKDLFGTKYAVDTGIVDETNGTAVVTKAATDVVAPGTKGSFDITIKGQPEVMSSITFAPSASVVVKDITVTKDTEVYNPIRWTVVVTNNTGDQSTIETPTTNTNLTTQGMIDAVNGLDVATLPANVDVDVVITISWEWVFEGGVSPITGYTVDQLDTILADTKAGVGNHNAELTCTTDLAFGLEVSVAQIEPK